MEAAEFLEQRDSPQPRGGLLHLHDLAVPNRGQRIRPLRPRGAARSEGGQRSPSIRPPVLGLNPFIGAAVPRTWARQSVMSSIA